MSAFDCGNAAHSGEHNEGEGDRSKIAADGYFCCNLSSVSLNSFISPIL